MKLRRQLLLVSIVALCLPWAGCQYIREMDQVLRDSQTAALMATAQAIAARLAAEPALLRTAGNPAARADPARQIYAHPLSHPVAVDGYDDEWRAWEIAPRVFGQSDFRMELLAGTHGEQLYLLVRVEDPVVDYHHPGRPGLASGDHLVLAVNHRDADTATHYVIATSGPGRVSVYARDHEGQRQREHRISGLWHEQPFGYQVELQLPRSLTEHGFAVAAVDRAPTQPGRHLGTLDESALLAASANDPGILPAVSGQVIYPHEELRRALAVFAQPGVRLQIADRDGWRLAEAGSLSSQPAAGENAPANPNWLLTAAYRAALAPRALPDYRDERDGRIANPLIERSWSEAAGSFWQQQGARQVGSAAAPIRLPPDSALAIEDLTLGVVLVETSSDRLLALTNSAFGRLLAVTLISTLTLGVVLLGYASLLSWRIRRLSRATRRAVSPDGQISALEQHWPQSHARDEIGELSRNYHQLLQRLQGYTEYLKTLTGKLSHELRTPLAVVRTSLDNLEHENQSPQAHVYAKRARGGAQRLSQLLTAMSEASRVEASIASAEREPVALDQLLTDMAAAYRDIYPERTLVLAIAPGDPEAYRLSAAPDLLAQMLDKLVDNAVDFCPPEGEIRLCLASVDADLELRVENTGPLLPRQMQAQLFDSLVSLRPERGEKTHLGLGLYIVRLIAEFHGGSARADNLADGSGVAFSIRIPARRELTSGAKWA